MRGNHFWMRWGRVLAVFGVLALLTTGLLYWKERDGRLTMLRQNETDYQRAFFHLNDMLAKMEKEFMNMELIHDPSASRRSWAQIWRYSTMAAYDFAQLPLIWSPMVNTQQTLHKLQMTAFEQAIHSGSQPPELAEPVHLWTKRIRQLSVSMQNVQQQFANADAGWSGLVQPDHSKDKSVKPLADGLDGVDRMQILLPERPGGSPGVHALSGNPTPLPKPAAAELTIRQTAAKWASRFGSRATRSADWGKIVYGEWSGRPSCTIQSVNGSEQIRLAGSRCQLLIEYADQTQPESGEKIRTADLRKQLTNRLNSWFGGRWMPEQIQPNHRWLTMKWVPLQGQVRLLADAVTVRVSLENGRILSFDAGAYWNGIRPRKLPQVNWDQSAVNALLDPQIGWKYGYQVLRTDEFGKEVRCARWFGEWDGQQAQVDINLTTGEAENIERWKK